MKFLTADDIIKVNALDGLSITGTQAIDHDFLAGLRDIRAASANTREGEMHRVASVPVVVVERWLREGFDIFRESASAIKARLHTEDLGVFVTTGKAV